MEVLLLNYFAAGYLFVYFNIDSHNVIRLTLIMDLVCITLFIRMSTLY